MTTSDEHHTDQPSDVPAGEQRREKLGEDVDVILDEIDDVLAKNAEDFVRSYVEKGGQGYSILLDPAFFPGAAAAAVVGAATWETFKAAFRNTR